MDIIPVQQKIKPNFLLNVFPGGNQSILRLFFMTVSFVSDFFFLNSFNKANLCTHEKPGRGSYLVADASRLFIKKP